jgi:PilZ domain
MEANPTATATALDKAARRSDRIRYAYRVQIAGKDSSGMAFDEPARTEVVTRDGGMVVTPLSLFTGTEIKITREPRTMQARIVGQVGLRDNEFLYGMQFVEAGSEPFWDVHFPVANPIGSAGKLVLQCTKCSRQELLHLSEIEMIVFETMRVIPHRCPACKLETLWLEPTILGDGAVVTGNESYATAGMAPRRSSRKVNDRQHARVQMRNIKACLHRPGFEDDVVTVTDLSRGGVAFMSLIDYVPGTVVEVAVPYTEGSANVFTPAKVIRVRCRPTVDIPGEFGLEYVKR